jgi:xanthine dehydrogenase YagT iron-sulfur-binding subunit
MEAPVATTAISIELHAPSTTRLTLRINGTERSLEVDSRVTLLDALRDYLGLTGTKKGCDHGECGACTVLVDGRRIDACLTFAVMQEGREITTIEGLAHGDELHPVQAAFIEHDGFQCGYCTPGQICSAVGMLHEAEAGWPSAVSADLAAEHVTLDDDEIRERMSGNLCRCAAYANIVPAIAEIIRKKQEERQAPPTREEVRL